MARELYLICFNCRLPLCPHELCPHCDAACERCKIHVTRGASRMYPLTAAALKAVAPLPTRDEPGPRDEPDGGDAA